MAASLVTGRGEMVLDRKVKGLQVDRSMSAPVPPLPLEALLPPAWREVLVPHLPAHALRDLGRWYDAECARGAVCPPRERLFAALEAVAPDEVRVVLLGQDPYPTLGVANGLAFSTTATASLPASLRRLYEGLRMDVGAAPPNGDLTGWATQGVLLLNTVLSVRAGAPNSHRKAGWEPFCRAVLTVLCDRAAPLVFLSLGRQAEGVVTSLAPPARHVHVISPHPSPLTGRRFFEACERDRPFSTVNRALIAAGHAPINWAAAAPG